MDSRQRAVKILLDTYWSPRGWKSAGQRDWQPHTDPDDLEFAMAQHVMFPPLRRGHDESISRIKRGVERTTPSAVGQAFTAGLGAKRLDWRSVLASYAVGRNMPKHTFRPPASDIRCEICGGYEEKDPVDVNVLNFERHKWGGVRHDDPSYISLDLEWFNQSPAAPPSSVAKEILVKTLDAASSMPGNAKLSDLASALSKIIPGNTQERRAAIGILGYAGVLQPRDRPSYLSGFVPLELREETPWSKDDWPYPIRWWKGRDGVDSTATRVWFGDCL